MATQEFYIRNETDTEARGPFNVEQLSSLIDSGQVTAATLYYDPNTEQWTAVGANNELKASLFPEKRKLTVRTQQKQDAVNQDPAGTAPITVSDMLAAAEGRTAETHDKQDPAEAMARAAGIGRWAAMAALLAAAAGEILPASDVLTAFEPGKLLTHPLVILGGADLLLAVVLGLGVVSVYPFVRFRAALGLGFLGFVFWTHGQPLLLLALAAGSVGLYCCTAFVRLVPVAVAALLGVGGFAVLAWMMLS